MYESGNSKGFGGKCNRGWGDNRPNPKGFDGIGRSVSYTHLTLPTIYSV